MADLRLHPYEDLAVTANGAGTAYTHRDEMVALCPGAGAPLVLALSRVSSCEAAGLMLLVAARQVMRERGGPLALAAVSVPVSKMLRVGGLASSFTICVTLRSARAAIAQLPPVAPDAS